MTGVNVMRATGWLMNLDRQVRAFGVYLTACSIYQVGLYMRTNGMASILDPRIGFFLIPGGEEWVTRIEWASAIWLLCLSLGLVFAVGKPLLLTYVLSEFLLALPTGLYIAVSLVGGAGHLTLVGTPLLILIGLTLAFTVFPLTLALYLSWKIGRQ